MYAIVKTGGKQYRVSLGDKLSVEKIDGEVGDTVKLDVLCTVDGKNVDVAQGSTAKANAKAKILEQFKDEKKLVFKFQKRKNYKKLRGHRQNMTLLEITSLGEESKEGE